MAARTSERMKFHIEITSTNGVRMTALHRTSLDEMSPRHAKTKAVGLLKLYARRGANGARVFNDKNQELYRW